MNSPGPAPHMMPNVMNQYQAPSNDPLQHQQTAAGGLHSYSHEEVKAFSDYINRVLKDDPDLAGDLPLDFQGGVFRTASKGVLLCKMLNLISPGCIDMRKLATRNPNPFQVTANHNLAIAAARNIGISTVNIGPGDLANGTPHLTLGLLWQVIRKGLMDKVNVDSHPEMMALLDKTKENVEEFVNLPPEQVLLRWFNYHLKRAGHPRQVNNFSEDIKDGQNYLVLLSQLAPGLVHPQEAHQPNIPQRAARVIQAAEALGCREFVTSPEDILSGNSKLNLAFVATLFNKNPTIQVAVDEEDVYRRALQEAEALMKQKLAEEMELRKKRWSEEEELRRKQWEAEEAAKRKAWEQEELARRGAMQREEQERLNALAQQERLLQQKRLEEEEKRRREWEEEQRRLQENLRRQEEEKERARQEAEQRQREEWERQKRQAEEEARKKAEWDRQQLAAQQQAAMQQAAQLQAQQQAAQLAYQQAMYAQQYAYMQQQQYAMQQQAAPVTYAAQSVGITFPIPKLCVTACRASGLPNSLTGLDPYCKISHKGGKQKTFYCPSTTTPVWNQDFDFQNFAQADELVVQIWHRSKLKKNSFLGEAIISGTDIVLGEKTFQLKPRRGFPDQVAGNVTLRFTAKQY